MNTLRNLARIRRIEFFIVEMTILLLPILVSIQSLREIATRTFAEAFLLFFLLYTLGDVVNCLADRDLDSTYKSHLSTAVYELGVSRVRVIVIASAVASAILVVHLAWATEKWLLVPLVFMGIFLGLGYSLRPIFFKGRGVLHLVCLWLLLYFLPMLFAGLLVTDSLTAEVVALAIAYSTVEMGIILVNTAEDYPEDRAEGVRTTTVALGLPRALGLAAFMTTVGGVAFVATLGAIFVQHAVPQPYFAVIAVALGVWGAVARQVVLLWRMVRAASPEEAIANVKNKAKQVPIWATAVGWSGVLCGGVLVYLR